MNAKIKREPTIVSKVGKPLRVQKHHLWLNKALGEVFAPNGMFIT